MSTQNRETNRRKRRRRNTRRKKRNLFTLILLLLVSLLLLFVFLFVIPAIKDRTANSMPTETETTSEIPTETETEIVLEKPLSYLERCELDFDHIDPPLKRDYDEAMAELKRLSTWYPALYQVYLNADKYPESMIITTVGNPEMAEFAYGYLTNDGSVTGGFTDEEQPEDYPLFLQWDERWGYMPYGGDGVMGTGGCGPTCLSMAVFYLTGDRECTPDAVARYSVEQGHYVNGVGTAWSLLEAYPKEYGLSVKHVYLGEENLKAELDKGNILICSVRPGDFTTAGHFILIYGYDENGFKVNDPKCVARSRVSWTYEQIQDDIKSTWSIGK